MPDARRTLHWATDSGGGSQIIMCESEARPILRRGKAGAAHFRELLRECKEVAKISKNGCGTFRVPELNWLTVPGKT